MFSIFVFACVVCLLFLLLTIETQTNFVAEQKKKCTNFWVSNRPVETGPQRQQQRQSRRSLQIVLQKAYPLKNKKFVMALCHHSSMLIQEWWL